MQLKDRVQLFLRIKPTAEGLQGDFVPTVQQLDEKMISLDSKVFKFDYIAPASTSLEEFFTEAVEPMTEEFCSGSSIVVFTYGQSGSGKTYTLYGNSKEKGMVQYTCENLMKGLSVENLTCSFIEVFQENIYDLLNKGNISCEETKNRLNIDGITEECLGLPADVENVLKRTQKRVGGGKGHSIFTVGISEKPQKIHFVDLAAAEKSKSFYSSQDKAKESALINKSLSALANVLKSMSQNSTFINFRDSKLTLFLKDYLQSSKILLISSIIPTKKSFIETINTIKFCQKVSKLKKVEPDFEEMKTITYLQQQIKTLQTSLLSYQVSQEILLKTEGDHKGCVKKEGELNEKIKDLEEEVRMLRKEILDFNRVDSGEWLLSSDSDEHESYQQISKEKSGLEVSLGNVRAMLEERSKELQEVNERLENSEKEREVQLKTNAELNEENLDLKAKVVKYQELCVLLGKLNSNLVSEMNFSGEASADCPPDFSYLSSTDASKIEIYKIIEGKDAKVYELVENCKNTEEHLHKLREKYFADTSAYKKQISRLKKELELTKAENIKDNEYAMQVLEGLKSEKNKLLSIIENLQDVSDKRKIAELKEMNSLLLENLKVKGQKVLELQKKFQDFLKEKENCDEIKEKLHRKGEKIQMFRNDFYKIQVQLNRIPQFRKKLETVGIVGCVLEILQLIHSRKGKSETIIQEFIINS